MDFKKRKSSLVSTWTPWGKAQYVYKFTRGINFYGTAGHGGFKVSKTMLKRMPINLQNSDGWYEEDCEWCKVALSFPQFFGEVELEAAELTFNKWFSNPCSEKSE